MKQMNYVRVAAATPKLKVGDISYNVEQIKILCKDAVKEKVDIIVFPELCITGYSCQDLFHNQDLIDRNNSGLFNICLFTNEPSIEGLIVIVGGIEDSGTGLYNSAFVYQNGAPISEPVRKKNLPNYKEFYEGRWFVSGNNQKPIIFEVDGYSTSLKFGIEICEDLWSPCPPSTDLTRAGAEIIFNLSASNELIGKHDYLVSLLKSTSSRNIGGYVYSSAGYGESTQDLVYAGNSIILENGKILSKSDRFSYDSQLSISDIDLDAIRNERRVNTTFTNFTREEIDHKVIRLPESYLNLDNTLMRNIDALPFVPNKDHYNRMEEILNIQSHALARRLHHTMMKPVIGVSGGSDSTWALIVIVEALKKLHIPNSNCIGISMPGFATSDRTKNNAMKLMNALGITSEEISISKIAKEELKALGHDGKTEDITYENVQARARTSILMNKSNELFGLVVGTGDLSELALGWCTYNADHMSMYGVNSSVPKTLVKFLISEYAKKQSDEIRVILEDIVATPVSPELTGTGASGENSQVTEDKIGPYELHDFFLYHTLRNNYTARKVEFLANNAKGFSKDYTEEEIHKWLVKFYDRFFKQQFKRSCLPDGPKIGSISLSPRGDWRMPSDITNFMKL